MGHIVDDQSAGSALERVCRFLEERSAWLRYEIDHGGSYMDLAPKYMECDYVAQTIRSGRYLDDGRPSWLGERHPATIAPVFPAQSQPRCSSWDRQMTDSPIPTTPTGGEPTAGAWVQLIAQARETHANAMNNSDLAFEGMWVARDEVLDPPLHNYWRVTATRTPTKPGVKPLIVTKALTKEPAVAALLTFVSTALPQFCDALERSQPLAARVAELEGMLAVTREKLKEISRACIPVGGSMCDGGYVDGMNSARRSIAPLVASAIAQLDKEAGGE